MQSPRLNLLGPVTLTGTTGKRPQRPGLALELVAFLALNPSDDAHGVTEALWPNTRIRPQTRRLTLLRARNWVGHRADGSPWVCLASEDGYRMAEGFEVDWHDFVDLAPAGSLPQTRTEDLVQAMQLITGRPLSAVPPTRWVWTELLHQEIVEHVQAVAVELLTRPEFSSPARVTAVTARALEVDRSHEGLWCAHLEAFIRTGATHRLASALGSAQIHLDGFDLAPSTVELLQRASRALA